MSFIRVADDRRRDETSPPNDKWNNARLWLAQTPADAAASAVSVASLSAAAAVCRRRRR